MNERASVKDLKVLKDGAVKGRGTLMTRQTSTINELSTSLPAVQFTTRG